MNLISWLLFYMLYIFGIFLSFGFFSFSSISSFWNIRNLFVSIFFFLMNISDVVERWLKFEKNPYQTVIFCKKEKVCYWYYYIFFMVFSFLKRKCWKSPNYIKRMIFTGPKKKKKGHVFIRLYKPLCWQRRRKILVKLLYVAY